MSEQSAMWVDRCHKYTIVDGESSFQINFAGMRFEDAELQAIEELRVVTQSNGLVERLLHPSGIMSHVAVEI